MKPDAPRGVRNRNPCSLRKGSPWEGLSDTQPDPDFCTFIANYWGFRAAFYVLIRYADRGVKTIADIISAWAPSTENDTAAYIADVCKRMQAQPTDVLNLKSYADAGRLVYAITYHEQGAVEPYFQVWEIEEGARRAGLTDVPVKPIHKTLQGIGAAVAVASSAAASQPDAITSIIANIKGVVDTTANHWVHVGFIVCALIGFGLVALGIVRNRQRHGI